MSDDKKNYSKTLNLPQTNFAMKAVSGEFPSLREFLEKEFQPLWQDVTFYAKEEWPESSKTA